MSGINSSTQSFAHIIKDNTQTTNTQNVTQASEVKETPQAPAKTETQGKPQTQEAEPPKTQASMAENHVQRVLKTNHVNHARVHTIHNLRHGLSHVQNVRKPVASRSSREMMVKEFLMQNAVSGDHRIVEGDEFSSNQDDRGDGRGGKEQHLEVELYKDQHQSIQSNLKPENKELAKDPQNTEQSDNKLEKEQSSIPTNTDSSKSQQTMQNQQNAANRIQDQLKNTIQANIQQNAKAAIQHHNEHHHSVHKKHADHMTAHGVHQINNHVKSNKQKTTNTDDDMYNPAVEFQELEERAIRTASGGSQNGDSDSGNNSNDSEKRSQEALLNRIKVKFSPSELPAVNNLAERLTPSNLSNENKIKVIEISHKLNISNDKTSADNLVDICNSPKFNKLNEVTQSKLIDFFKNDKIESSSAKKINMEDVSGTKKVNLSGELTGVTLNTISSITNSNSVVQVNTANIKVSSEFDASLTIVTQNKNSSKAKLVKDKIFGSALELKLGKVNSDQFKNASTTAVNKLSGTFSKHINTTANLNVSDNNIKTVLEKSFGKILESFSKLKISSNNPYNNIRIPITQNEADQLDSDNIYLKLNSISQALSGFNHTDTEKYGELQDSIQQMEKDLEQFLKQRF